MMDPFLLKYGDPVEVKLTAKNSVGEATPAIATSYIGLIPYICGQLEFGDPNLEFDDTRVYPSDS